MCEIARTTSAALGVYWIYMRSVKFHSRSEGTGKEKHLLPVPGF